MCKLELLEGSNCIYQTGNEGKRILQKNYLASSLAGITLAPVIFH